MLVGGFSAAQGVFWMMVSPGNIVGDVIDNPPQMLFRMVPSNLIGWLDLPLHLASHLPSPITIDSLGKSASHFMQCRNFN